MALALVFLPLLLPEPPSAVQSGGKGRKRVVWKPSVFESMAHFIDIQPVRQLFR